MSKQIIDGLFLTERITGIQRYAIEIVKELDKIVDKDTVEIVVPSNYVESIILKRIKIKKIGINKGRIWEQIDLPIYLKQSGGNAIYFENTFPIMHRKGIITIHDISLKVNPHFFNQTIRGRMSILWRRINYFLALKSKMKIVTVSEFSKREIMKYYKTDPERIHVICNAWQHIADVDEDKSLFNKFERIDKGQYFFAMATLAKNKNFEWIINAAKNNSTEFFVIAGGGKIEQFARENNINKTGNILLLGYVTDNEAKALMKNCKAFVFPTFYEGFGIPPLEALACGAKSIIVSDTEIMHEVYGQSAMYIDPYEKNPTINDIHPITESQRKELLNKYSWRKSAQMLKDLIEQ